MPNLSADTPSNNTSLHGPTPAWEGALLEMKAQIQSLDAQLTRERQRRRAQGVAFLAATVGVFLLVPGAQQAVAQSARDLTARVLILERLTQALRSDLNAEKAAREAADATLQTRAGALEGKTQFMRVEGTTTLFTGTNLQIVNGLGATSGNPNYPAALDPADTQVNSLGNLIVGYNEDWNERSRTGSHNVVIGADHGYTSFGGLVVGANNQILGPYSSVSGGGYNIAHGKFAAVSGGGDNHAVSLYSSVSGGTSNWAGTDRWGENYGRFTSVSGGSENQAVLDGSSISGGNHNTTMGLFASVSGGDRNTAGGWWSSISGGSGNTTGGWYSSVSGGYENWAVGAASSVSGGFERSTGDGKSWVAGGLFQEF